MRGSVITLKKMRGSVISGNIWFRQSNITRSINRLALQARLTLIRLQTVATQTGEERDVQGSVRQTH